MTRSVRRWMGMAAMLSVAACLAGPATARPPPLPLASVDMSRVQGQWYLIATIPNSFERGLVGPRTVYSPRPDGGLREDFYTRRGSFEAPERHLSDRTTIRPGTNNAHWQVHVLPLISLPFLVVYTDPDYRYVLFGEESRDLGWIYARTPVVPEADYQDLLARFASAGYDATRFRRFIQTPSQIGRPGFWSDNIRPPPAK